MTEEEQQKIPLAERFDRRVKKLMGYKPRKDPRKEEKPLFAAFQDRAVASVVDTAVIYLLLQDVFNFITAHIFRYADIPAMRAAQEGAPTQGTLLDKAEYFVVSSFDSGLAQLWLANSVMQSILIGAILVFMWCKFDCTLGKFLIGLEFAGKDGEGKPTFKQYLLRFAGFYLSMPVFMIGFAYLGLDKKKRAWHDIIAGTTVVYSKRGSIFRQAWDLLKRLVKR